MNKLIIQLNINRDKAKETLYHYIECGFWNDAKGKIEAIKTIEDNIKKAKSGDLK